jgi:hypothetical protein
MKEMPADQDISSGRVLRAFSCKVETFEPETFEPKTFEPNQHLMADEVLAIPVADRRALVDGGYLQIYAHQRQAPPWNPRGEHERAALRAWFIEQLDARDYAQYERDLNSSLRLVASLTAPAAQLPAQDRERVMRDRKRALQAIHAAGPKAQWRHGNPEPLRKAYPEIAECLRDEPPRDRGRYRAQAQQERGDQQRRRAQAADDVRYLDGLWNHRGRWKGEQGARRLAIEIVARRRGLTEDAVEDAVRRGESTR